MRMLADGQADMWFTGGSYFPHPQYIKLGARHSFKLLSISKEVAEAVGKKFGQEIMEVPAGIYADNNGQNEMYWSPATIVTFGVRTDLDEELVYQMTKALANHKEEFWQVHKMHKFYRPRGCLAERRRRPSAPRRCPVLQGNGPHALSCMR